MSNYSVYNPNQAAVDSSAQWRDNAYARLNELGAQRQAWTNKMYAEQQAAQAKAVEEGRRQTYGTAAQGAAIGANVGGMGALIGGVAGLGLGGLSEAAGRHSEGGSWGDALKSSFLRGPSQNETQQMVRSAATAVPLLMADSATGGKMGAAVGGAVAGQATSPGGILGPGGQAGAANGLAAPYVPSGARMSVSPGEISGLAGYATPKPVLGGVSHGSGGEMGPPSPNWTSPFTNMPSQYDENSDPLYYTDQVTSSGSSQYPSSK